METRERTEETCEATPKTCRTPRGRRIIVSLKRSRESPVNKEEDEVLTSIVRRKTNDNKDNILEVKTRGQSLRFMQVPTPRIPSADAKSPLKKRRSRLVDKFRSMAAGNGESSKIQQSTEIKSLSKETKMEICERAGITQKVEMTCADQVAMKTSLGLSWTQSRAIKRYWQSAQVTYASEREERKEREKIL